MTFSVSKPAWLLRKTFIRLIILMEITALSTKRIEDMTPRIAICWTNEKLVRCNFCSNCSKPGEVRELTPATESAPMAPRSATPTKSRVFSKT